MKYLTTLIFSLLLLSCASQKIDKNPPFTISDGSFNKWLGGQPGVSGIRIIMSYNSSKKVEFKKIYFNNKEGELELYNRKEKKYLIGSIKTGTRKGGSLILDIDPKKEMKNEAPNIVKPPINLKKNEAALVYIYKGKEYFYKVINLKKTDSDFYP